MKNTNRISGVSSLRKSRVDKFDELAGNAIVVVDDFLTAAECNRLLLRLDNDAWRRSAVASLDQDGAIRSDICDTRTSQTLFEYDFSRVFEREVSRIEFKIADRLAIDAMRFEGWQVTKYGYQQGFQAHHDCGLWRDEPGGEREKTVMVCLMAPIEGGETHFRALNLFVGAVQGRLVIWDNLLPTGKCNHAMIHSGEPVRRGIKVILHTWVRQFSVPGSRRNDHVESN